MLWVNGPMRVGNGGSTNCLAPGTMFVPNNLFLFWEPILIIILFKSPQSTAVSIIAGTGIGGVALGLAIGVLALVLFKRVRRRRQRSPSQNYFASQHFSSTKPYKAPSIVPSTITPSSAPRTYQQILSSSLAQIPEPENPEPPTPTASGFSRSSSYASSVPTTPDSTASFSTHTSRTVRNLPGVPLQPLRLNRETNSHLSVSEPSVSGTSDSGTVTEQNHYPLDVKVRLGIQEQQQPDDSASIISSSTVNANRSSRLARVPTYASSSARHPRNVYVIDENDEAPDVPPEYGRHTDDTSCTPSIISSGLGRIPSSYISSGRF